MEIKAKGPNENRIEKNIALTQLPDYTQFPD